MSVGTVVLGKGPDASGVVPLTLLVSVVVGRRRRRPIWDLLESEVQWDFDEMRRRSPPTVEDWMRPHRDRRDEEVRTPFLGESKVFTRTPYCLSRVLTDSIETGVLVGRGGLGRSTSRGF